MTRKTGRRRGKCYRQVQTCLVFIEHTYSFFIKLEHCLSKYVTFNQDLENNVYFILTMQWTTITNSTAIERRRKKKLCQQILPNNKHRVETCTNVRVIIDFRLNFLFLVLHLHIYQSREKEKECLRNTNNVTLFILFIIIELLKLRQVVIHYYYCRLYWFCLTQVESTNLIIV